MNMVFRTELNEGSLKVINLVLSEITSLNIGSDKALAH